MQVGFKFEIRTSVAVILTFDCMDRFAKNIRNTAVASIEWYLRSFLLEKTRRRNSEDDDQSFTEFCRDNISQDDLQSPMTGAIFR